MMSPMQHYAEAERLLAEGEAVVAKIAEANEQCTAVGVFEQLTLTNRMDELGKKAMGIWAQAQVHATLAAALPRTANVAVVAQPQPVHEFGTTKAGPSKFMTDGGHR